MTSRQQTALLVSAAAISAFFAGYVVALHGGAHGLDKSPDEFGAPALRSGEELAPPTESVSNEEMTPEDFRAKTFEILSINNDVERYAQFCALLLRVTPENWRQIEEAFRRQRQEEGRLYGLEVTLFYDRVGSLLGKEGMEIALAPGSKLKGSADEILGGWAEADPKSAHAWLETQSKERQAMLFGPLLRGIGESDPEMAMRLMLGRSNDLWRETLPSILDSTFHRGGFRAAESLYQYLRNFPNAPELALADILGELVHKQTLMHNLEVRGPLEWFDAYFPAEPDALYRAFRNFGSLNPAHTAAWLEARASRMNSQQANRAYEALAGAWYSKAPDECLVWLKLNIAHSSYDAMAVVIIRELADAEDLVMARQVLDAVRDPEARKEAEHRLERVEGYISLKGKL